MLKIITYISVVKNMIKNFGLKETYSFIINLLSIFFDYLPFLCFLPYICSLSS